MNPSARVENGPTDMHPDDLAKRKRDAAIAYCHREVGLLRESLVKLEARHAHPDKIANQRAMVEAAEAALAAAKGE